MSNSRIAVRVSERRNDSGAELAAPSTLTAELNDTQRRITVSGELDYATTRELTGFMAGLMALGPGDSTIDISGLTFIDAGGLGVLARFNNELRAQQAQLIVTGATPRQRRLFSIVGLDGLLRAE